MINILIYIICIALSGYLWHMGGQGHKWCRQIVGLGIVVGKLLLGMNWLVLGYWLALYLLVQGFSYGLSSPVHKFWVWVVGSGSQGNNTTVEILTRLTCALAWSAAGWAIVAVGGSVATQIWYTLLCTMLVVGFGVDENVQVSEIGTGCSVGLAILV